ncbi:unnamed protein product [Arctogadus glacialis]
MHISHTAISNNPIKYHLTNLGNYPQTIMAIPPCAPSHTLITPQQYCAFGVHLYHMVVLEKPHSHTVTVNRTFRGEEEGAISV